MDKFTVLDGVAAPLMLANINTDAILPSVWVLNPDTDLGEKLFANWRYDATGAEIPEFVLNQPPYRQSRILIAGPNFGCGSSREAAVWALYRYGIRCVIAPSFGDIFQENCFQNGLLPVKLPADQVEVMAAALAKATDPRAIINLARGIIEWPGLNDIPFELSAVRRDALLQGLDNMTLMMRWLPDVEQYERRDAVTRPWVYDPNPT
jgi:3-isopropylmalate/(R)-2-methylmalate dehydratase small subunit